MVSIVQIPFYTVRTLGQVPAIGFRLSAIADTGIARLRSEFPAKQKLRTAHPCNDCPATIRGRVPQKYHCSKYCADNIRGLHLRFRSRTLRGFLPPYSFRLLRRRSQRTGYCLPTIQKTDNPGRRSSENIHSVAISRLRFLAAS